MERKEKIKTLYHRLFEAERRGDKPLQDNLRLQIKQALSGNPTILEQFFHNLSDKPFVKNFRRIVRSESLSDISLAKSLSSYVTHALIEMEKQQGVYQDLSISEAAHLLSRFISGDASPSEVTSYISDNFSFLRER